MGWITVNPITGQPQLQDMATSLDVVVEVDSCHGVQHQCSQSCSCHLVPIASPLPCLRLHPCCIGCLLCVTQYTVVTETFSRPPHDDILPEQRGFSGQRGAYQCDELNASDKQIVYLVISTQYCNVMHHGSPPLSTLEEEKHFGQLSRSGELAASESEANMSTDFSLTVTRKNYPFSGDQHHPSDPQLHFKVDGLLRPVCPFGARAHRLTTDEASPPDGTMLAGKTVSVVFRDKNVRWFAAVHVGGVYRVRCADVKNTPASSLPGDSASLSLSSPVTITRVFLGDDVTVSEPLLLGCDEGDFFSFL